MAELRFALVLLVLLTLSVFIMMAALVLMARDVRRTLRAITGLVPPCRRVLHVSTMVLGEARGLLARTHAAGRQVQDTVGRVCEATTETLDDLLAVKRRAQDYLSGRFGNGNGHKTARSEPRRGHRKSWEEGGHGK